MSEADQKAFDDAQKKLREAAELKATEQAEAAVADLKAKTSVEGYVKPTISFAD